uniref:TFIIS-type domain-containing protein n=1 Tax=viral metagenome TaxID=1070528 RepID=A0A6C0HLF5_9ZZZZ
MASIFVQPLIFKQNKSDTNVALLETKLEWKKQIGTVALKRGISIDDYVRSKYSDKLAEICKTTNKLVELLFSFSINEKSDFFMFGIKSNVKTVLQYGVNLPAVCGIITYANVTSNGKQIEYNGIIIGFSVNRETYYLEDAKISEYLQHCKEYDSVGSIGSDNDVESEISGNNNSDNDDNDDNDNDDNDNDDNDDNDNDDNDDNDNDDNDNDDNDNETEKDKTNNDDLECDSQDVDGDANDCDSNIDIDVSDGLTDDDAVVEDGLTDDDAVADDEQEDGQDDATGNDPCDDGEFGGDAECELDDETAHLPKKKSAPSRSTKIMANLDMSIIFNILDTEPIDKITPDSALHEKRKLILTILKKLDFTAKIVQLIEKGIYNYTIDKCNFKQYIPLWECPEFVDIYITKAKNLYTNLNAACYVKNAGLINKVKNGTILPYELAFIDNFKLYPEKWQDIIEEKARTEKMIKDSIIETATDIFQCSRCKQRKTLYCEVQTRSSDEPMTKFITCLNCGKKWKQY